MEKIKKDLTNERLKKSFVSQFDLVNYAIKLAEDVVTSGRPLQTRDGEQNNLALEILQEIAVEKENALQEKSSLECKDLSRKEAEDEEERYAAIMPAGVEVKS